LKVAGVFKEDLSLERLSRQQLIALCKYLSVPVIGSNYMIIFNLNKKLEKLRNDDNVCFLLPITFVTDYQNHNQPTNAHNSR